MNAKDLIIIALLIIILFVLFKVFQFTKPLQPVEKQYTPDIENEPASTKEKATGKIKIKPTGKRILELLEDNIPKTEETLFRLYNKKYFVKRWYFRKYLKWIDENNFILSENFEDGKVWGLPEMFENGTLKDEYVSLIK